MCCDGENIIIGIIDSGLDTNIINNNDKIIFGGHVDKINNNYVVKENNFSDQIGHGTAVYSIINKKLFKILEINYVIIKIFNNNLLTNVDSLICAIKKCLELKCNIINISAVITNNNFDLEDICKKAYENNVKIVAAESNFPSNIALPARYSTCYGVKPGSCHGKYDYYFDEKIESQFIARGDNQRITWLNQTQLFMGGASFAAAHITAFIALILQSNKNMSIADLNDRLKEKSLTSPPPLIPPTHEAKLNLFIDSEEMHAEAVRFLNWNKHNEKYTHPIVLSNKNDIFGNNFLTTNNSKNIPICEYDSVFICRDFHIDNYFSFEKDLISQNKYIYYLYPDYKRNNKRSVNNHLIGDFNFDYNYMILHRYKKLERYLFNYYVKAPILGMISTDITYEVWNKANILKSLFDNEGYRAVIFDTTSYSNVFGADASCCCSSDNDLISDYSNYKRIFSLFLKCLDYHYCPDIIIVIGRISLTKDSMINQNANSIIQSCAFIYACLIEAFIGCNNDMIINDKFINNLETISKGKYIGSINDQNILNIFNQVKEYFR